MAAHRRAATAATRVALVTAAQPFVRQHGFTVRAIKEAVASSSSSSSSFSHDNVDVDELFSPPIEATRCLLREFDVCALRRAEHALESGDDKDEHGTRATKDDEKTELLLAGKLFQCAPMREPLVDALARLTAASASTIPSTVKRSWNVVDEAMHMTRADRSLHTTQWYTDRLRLANAYLLAELHLLSPQRRGDDDDDDVRASVRLFRRLARRSTNGPTSVDVGAWINWGARGWLGMCVAKR